jgi:hypothetical protein
MMGMREVRIEYKISVGKSEGNRPLEGSKYKWDVNMNI